MATSAQTNRPTPERIFNTLNAYQQTAALKTGIELGIFTLIGEGVGTSAPLAAKVGAAERGVRILCDYLTIHGFLLKDNGQYALTQESTIFLNQHSPAYMGGVAGFLLNDELVGNFRELTAAVKKGKSPGVHGDNEKPNDDAWVAFAKSMVPLTVPIATYISELTGMAAGKACKILDIAAGHGMYGISLARNNPNAQVTALDWPNVLNVAKENAQAAGVTNRYSVIAGNAFEVELGTGYDFVLLTNFFHHFNQETCQKLMKRVHAALKPDGKAVTLEFVPNEDRVTPPMAAGFSMIMLANTDEGDAYTLSEYEKMFTKTGFAKTTLYAVPEMPQQVMISEK